MDINIYSILEQCNFQLEPAVQILHRLTGADLEDCLDMIKAYVDAAEQLSHEDEAPGHAPAPRKPEQTRAVPPSSGPDNTADILMMILQEIRRNNQLLENIQGTLQEIRGDGLYNSLTDVCTKLEESANAIRGDGLYNSLSDVCGRLEECAGNIKGDGLYDNLSDVCDKLDAIQNDLDALCINLL